MTENKEMKNLRSKSSKNPYADAGLFSLLTYSFANRIINNIYKRGFSKPGDIYKTTPDLDTLRIAEQIQNEWDKRLQAKASPDIFSIVLHINKIFFISQAFLLTADSVLRVGRCVFIYYLLQDFRTYNIQSSCIHAFGMIFCLVSTIFLYNRVSYRGFTKGAVVRGALSTLLYKNMLKLKLSSNVSTGEIISLLTNDLQKFEAICWGYALLYVPAIEFALILVIYFYAPIFNGRSPIFLVPIAVLLALFLVQLASSFRMGQLSKRVTPAKDEVTKGMADVLSGIQILKYFHWEGPFFQRVFALKRVVVNIFQTMFFLKSVIVALYFNSSVVGSTVFKLIRTNDDGAMNYTVLSLLQLISRSVCDLFPRALEAWIDVRHASRRVSSFLVKASTSENSLNIVEQMPDELALRITNATLSWPESSGESSGFYSLESYGTTMKIPVKSVSFEIQKGDFCMIMGPVGSGKSALLLSILGELYLIGGEIVHSGKIAYVPQSPWIIAGTVRENILFGRPYCPELYAKVVKTACLEIDFRNMEKADMTQIADGGTSLSGGQRSRISLARALYSSEAEIFLLDDVLSAVDNKVGKAIFKGLTSFFAGKKTCLFISHQIQFAKYCSKIMLLRKGSIKYFGSYERLIQNKGLDFVNELLTCHEEKKDNKEPSSEETQLVFAPAVAVENAEECEDNVYEEKDTCTKTSAKAFLSFIHRSYSVPMLLVILVIVLGTEVISIFHSRLLKEETTLPLKVQLLTATGILFLLYIARSFLLLSIPFRSAVSLFADAFHRLLHTSLLFFLENPQGVILNRLSKDQSLIEEQLPGYFLDLCQNGLKVVVTVFVCIWVQPMILLAVPIVFIPCFCYRKKFVFSSIAIKRIESTSRSPCYSMFTSTLPGLSSIRCFGSERIFLKRFVRYQNFNTSAMHACVFTSRWFAFRVDLLSVAFLVIFLMLVIVQLRAVPQKGSSMIGFALTTCTTLLGILQWTLRVYSEIQTLLCCVERVEEYAKLPYEEDPEKSKNALKVPSNWPDKGHVSFRGVSLRYPNSAKRVLNDITVEFMPKQKIAVVGRTGAGKTSMISGIFRILEPFPEDSLVIDSVSISQLSLGELRSRIAIIPQEPFLFKGTVRFNLDPFNQHSDTELWDAIEEAELMQVIKDMPQLLEAEVQEGGNNFSVGERQLVCLARAILKKPKVIVMDEATANIDILTTEKIIKAMATSFADSTVITIVHRLHTIIEYDKVLVLDKGKVAEFDSPFNLLSTEESIFRGMVAELGDEAVEAMREIAQKSDERKQQKSDEQK